MKTVDLTHNKLSRPIYLVAEQIAFWYSGPDGSTFIYSAGGAGCDVVEPCAVVAEKVAAALKQNKEENK